MPVCDKHEHERVCARHFHELEWQGAKKELAHRHGALAVAVSFLHAHNHGG